MAFAESPCGGEEAAVLAVYLDSVLRDERREEERTELLRSCPDVFGGEGGSALLAWLHKCNGFAVEGGVSLVGVPSAD
jgi:hypothetical protein